jgi:hypothetical protein
VDVDSFVRDGFVAIREAVDAGAAAALAITSALAMTE